MEIKPGDLVMLIKPRECCGDCSGLGTVSIVGERPLIYKYSSMTSPNGCCGQSIRLHDDWVWIENSACNQSRLKKIDPPSEGDSLPTRADLKLEA